MLGFVGVVGSPVSASFDVEALALRYGLRFCIRLLGKEMAGPASGDVR